MQWLWLVALVSIVFFFWKARRYAQIDANLLINSIVKNSLTNLGYEPDAESLTFFATHPFLSARLWKALGDGGATGMVGGQISEDSQLSCGKFLRYVRDPEFRKMCPCAGAIMQYAVHICDRSPEQLFGCMHPREELEQRKNESSVQSRR